MIALTNYMSQLIGIYLNYENVNTVQYKIRVNLFPISKKALSC